MKKFQIMIVMAICLLMVASAGASAWAPFVPSTAMPAAPVEKAELSSPNIERFLERGPSEWSLRGALSMRVEQILNPKALSKETITQIKEDYLRVMYAGKLSPQTIDELRTPRYFGTYNGGIAMYIDPLATAPAGAAGELIVAGIKLEWPTDSSRPYIYKNNTFTDLLTAYESGMLAEEDIRDIKECMDKEEWVLVPNPRTPETLSRETVAQLKEDYLRVIYATSPFPPTLDELEEPRYLGTYNGGIAMYIDPPGPWLGMMGWFHIAGYTLRWPTISGCPYIYKDNTFTDLRAAYQSGMITERDIFDIQYYLGQEDWSFVPHPKTPEVLSDETIAQIKRDYFNHSSEGLFLPPTLDELKEPRYFGTYNGGIAMYIDPPADAPAGAAGEVIVAETKIQWPTDSSRPYIYKNNTFTDLLTAYEKGMITPRNLYDIIHHMKTEDWGPIPCPKTPEFLSDEQISQIKNDYWEYYFTEVNPNGDKNITPDEIDAPRYFGTYNGGIALFINPFYPLIGFTRSLFIAGYEISWPYPPNVPPYIYKDNTFTELPAAYESGMITARDVRDIKYYMDREEWFPAQPSLTAPEILGGEQISRVENGCLAHYFGTLCCFGTYNGGIALLITPANL